MRLQQLVRHAPYDYYANSRRLERIRAYVSGQSDYQNLRYTYDAAGNVKSITDGVSSHVDEASGTRSNLTYDDYYRLLSYTRPTSSGFQTYSFSYDAIGNLLSNGDSGGGAYVYPPSGPLSVRPHAVSSANGHSYSYDDVGNMTAKGPIGSQDVLNYDAWNRLSSVVPASGATVYFGYGADHGRLWKQVGARRSLWIGDYYEEHSGEQLAHVLVDGKRICTLEILPIPIGGGSSQSSPDDVFDYYHSDQLGSSNIITKRDGTVRQQFQYSAFGDDLYIDDPAGFTVTHRYTDQVLDGETGLYYYGARYYDPELARFAQADLVTADVYEPQSLNRYTYVVNNPVRYTDPTGFVPQDGGITEGAFRQLFGGWGYGLHRAKVQVVESAAVAVQSTKVAATNAVMGDAAPAPPSGYEAAALAGQVIGGEVLGLYGDSRDLAVSTFRLATGAGSVSDVGLAGLGFIPGVGSLKHFKRLNATGGAARVKKVVPVEGAGPHSGFKRDPQTGTVTGYTEFDGAGNPVKRYRGTGGSHGPVQPPLIVEPKSGKGPGAPLRRARPARPDEIPGGGK